MASSCDSWRKVELDDFLKKVAEKEKKTGKHFNYDSFCYFLAGYTKGVPLLAKDTAYNELRRSFRWRKVEA